MSTDVSEESPAFFFRTEGGSSSDKYWGFGGVFSAGFKEDVWCKAQLWIGWAVPQIWVSPRIFMIEFSENMSQKMSPDKQKSREMAVIALKVFINPKLIIANYEEVYFRKPVRDWRGFSAGAARYPEILVTGVDAEGKQTPFLGWHLVGQLVSFSMKWITSVVVCMLILWFVQHSLAHVGRKWVEVVIECMFHLHQNDRYWMCILLFLISCWVVGKFWKCK